MGIQVAVAIPTYNREAVLIATISQVLAQSPPADEVLVIDQSESHATETERALKDWQAQGAIRYVRHAPPNLPGARNKALRETTCDIVIFIDDDVDLRDGFVGSHLRNYLLEPTVVAVAGRASQRLGWPRRRRPRRWRPSLDYLFFDFNSAERKEGIGAFCGGNHSVRRKEILKLGGYDEAFEGTALREESDLALRVIAAGGKIIFEPNAYLHHLAVPSGGCRVQEWGDLSAARSVLRFASKHWRTLGWYAIREVWLAYRLGVMNRANLRRPTALLASTIRLSRLLLRLGKETVR